MAPEHTGPFCWLLDCFLPFSLPRDCLLLTCFLLTCLLLA